MTLLRSLAGLVLLLAALTGNTQSFAPIPPLAARVTDAVGMLTPAQKQSLENVLQEYETRTGSQIVILLVGKTEPEAIEQYGIRVAEAWKVGRKGVDDGVILIVARDNPKALRRLRIEAGRGVQGSLTDAQSKRILQDVIAPHFRQNDFYGGLAAGVSAIANLLDREHLPAPQGAKQQNAEEDSFGGWAPILFILFMMWVMISRIRRAQRSFYGNRWGRSSGIILGGGLGGFGGFGGGSSGGGGGFSGGGGTFDGGGASGDW